MSPNKISNSFLGQRSFRKFITVLSLLLIGVNGWGQLTENFNTGLPASYSTGTCSLNSGTWNITTVMKGTSIVSAICAQLQSVTGSKITTPTFNNGVGILSFNVAASTTAGSYQVNISTEQSGFW